jgi:hypothetical protein
MRHRGSTTIALGANGYQAPELISARRTTDDEGPSNESYTDREIFYNRLSTKTDVYAFAMVALEVCSKILLSIHAYLCTDIVSY